MDVIAFEVEHAGNQVEGLRAGPHGAPALVFHNGTPTAAMLLPSVVAAAARHDLQVVTFSRPGYAGSARLAGRSVADNAAITAQVLDAVSAAYFVTVGWSGGGPHALADVVLLADRCRAGATIAGVAPFDAGIEWLANMGEENVEEFVLAIEGPDALTPFLDAFASALGGIQPDDLAASLGGLVSDVDRAALTGEFAAYMAASMRGAVSSGISGWLDDDLAFVKPWGFDIADVARPVAVWQGAQDKMVPFAHGEWLATHVPNAVGNLRPDEGHLSLAVGMIDAIIDDLVARAG